jgi:dodecin
LGLFVIAGVALESYSDGRAEQAKASFAYASKRFAPTGKELFMTDGVFKLIELTGTSTVSQEHAVQAAISQAAKSVRNMQWFQVTESRGSIKDGKVSEWQVTLKIGFKIEG